MKLLQKTTISFLTAILTLIFTYGGYTLYAESAISEYGHLEDYLTFKNPVGAFSTVKSDYHDAMNQYFNDKMEKLVELLDGDDKFYEKPEFKAPSEVDSSSYAKQCGKDNVSTYCVAMGAMDLYIIYVETLNEMKGYLPTGEVPDDATVEQLFKANKDRDGQIDAEVEEAKIVMEGTVAVYDEFRQAYPMHKKYEKVMKNLIKYKEALKKIRQITAKYPGKFHDASTSECK